MIQGKLARPIDARRFICHPHRSARYRQIRNASKTIPHRPRIHWIRPFCHQADQEA
jgi:hypothetical protein